ncbi:MAG: Thiol-disulfide oxidoreductase ResA [Fimbriimonadaceae bacterium]|nr:Thiol-disulfide oxidoreductase ResA [Fimbriimonadaceae bacterium]
MERSAVRAGGSALNMLSLALVAGLWIPGGMSGKEALDSLNKYRTELQQEAMKTRDTAALSAIGDKVSAKANELIGELAPAKIEAAESLDWSKVFAAAKRHKDALFLASRYLETNPTNSDLYLAHTQVMSCAAMVPDAAALKKSLSVIKPSSPTESMSLANMTAYQYLEVIEKAEGKKAALDLLTSVESRMMWSGLVDAKQQPMIESSQIALAGARKDLLMGLGRRDEAIAGLKKFKATLNPESTNVRRVDAMIVQGELLEAAAPTIPFTKTIGEFTSLESLKGKVVLVDFFAHWCGPCIRSFPELVEMKNEWGSKGLEVVGVTRYYGYYKRENAEKRDMAQDVEFGKMKEFMAEHKMTWPVIYTDKAPYDSYGVTGIPHVAVIGRDGKVKHVKIGYSPDGMAEFKALVGKLLEEK